MQKAGIIIVFLAIVLFIGGFFFLQVEEVGIEDITWESIPAKIAFNPVERASQNGLLITRLSDGVEQFYVGEWDTAFEFGNNVYIFGSENKESEQKVFRINAQDKVSEITIPKEFGEVVDVSQNANASYISIQTKYQNVSYVCVAELANNIDLNCNKLAILGDIESIWNPENEQEALFKSSAKDSYKIFALNPWNDVEPRSYEKEAKEYEQYLSYFERKGEQRGRVHKFLNIAYIELDGRRYLQHVPLNSELVLFADYEHILIKNKDTVEVQEFSTKKRAELYTLPELENTTIYFKGLIGHPSQL